MILLKNSHTYIW